MSKLTKWLHKRGIHWYSVPIERFQKDLWYVEGKDGAGSQEKFQIFLRVKCQHCNKRKNKLQSTVTRTYS